MGSPSVCTVAISSLPSSPSSVRCLPFQKLKRLLLWYHRHTAASPAAANITRMSLTKLLFHPFWSVHICCHEHVFKCTPSTCASVALRDVARHQTPPWIQFAHFSVVRPCCSISIYMAWTLNIPLDDLYFPKDTQTRTDSTLLGYVTNDRFHCVIWWCLFRNMHAYFCPF